MEKYTMFMDWKNQFTLIHGPNIPGSYAVLFFIALDLTSITSHIHNWAFSFGSASSFFLELFLHWSPVDMGTFRWGSSSFSVLSFCLFMLYMGFSRQEYWNNSRKNEGMAPKQKQHPVVEVTGDRSKVWHCKEQYCIGTWNVRSMNQGKLEVVKQEMARVNIDILGISELRWTGMGEFNSDDHYIYDCGQESLRRNGVAIIVNRRFQNAVLGCNLKNDRMILFDFKANHSITVIQV